MEEENKKDKWAFLKKLILAILGIVGVSSISIFNNTYIRDNASYKITSNNQNGEIIAGEVKN